MEYVSPKHRQLVADYRRREAATDDACWPQRPDAKNRIITFDPRPVEPEQD
ncbi:hypothetical protein [Streptacidiphilus sp. EB129]|uniref:hypothetical protein n=1 Tax=Streptacidiphilus sp. EB129 TaxID=3156262 RepID=UPI0035163FDD